MKEETLKMIVNTLKLRMSDYKSDTDAYKELKNAIDMLTAKCYIK